MKRGWAACGLVFGLALLAAPTEAQMGGARGTVVDDEGQPVADAKILFESRGGVARTYEAKTDEKGQYIRVGITRGPYRITAMGPGLERRSTARKEQAVDLLNLRTFSRRII